MNVSEAPLDRESLQRFLETFDPTAKRRGKNYYDSGSVRNLQGAPDGLSFSAEVQVGEIFNVSAKKGAKGWETKCSCFVQRHCKHAYAAMLAFRDGRLSVEDPRPTTNSSPLAPPQRLQALTAAKLGRRMTNAEASYIRAVEGLYQRWQRAKTLTGWDLQAIGIYDLGFGPAEAQLWHQPPRTEFEFWLYLAHAIKERNGSVPDFLLPVTDFSAIKEGLASWARGREIKAWEQRFEILGDELQPAASVTLDARLVITADCAKLEVRPTGQEQFAHPSAQELSRWVEQQSVGQVEIVPEAFPIWSQFAGTWQYGATSTLDLSLPRTAQIISHLLRSTSLRDRILGSTGEPFVWAQAPLEWRLEAAQDETDDYRLKLVTSDGQPAPPMLAALPGHPPLYLTADTVYPGPPPTSALDLRRTNVIPAPALETKAGVNLLVSLGMPIPERIQPKIRRTTTKISFRCALKPLYPGSPSEGLFLEALSVNPETMEVEVYGNHGWHPKPSQRAKKNPNREGTIFMVDRSIEHQVPAILQPLGLTFDYTMSLWRLRVKRGFPEVFADWLATVPKEIEVQLGGDLASLSENSISAKVSLDCTEAGVDWFDLRVTVDVADATLSPAEVKVLLDARGGFVRLEGKGWRRLKFNLSEEEEKDLAKLGLSLKDFSSEPQRLHALQLADESAKRLLPEARVEQVQRRVDEIKTRVQPELPAVIKATLRPYQVEGFHFLSYLSSNRFGGILADDMGLGKTIQTLTWIAWLRSQPEATAQPTLVVCPKSVMENWSNEAARFYPELRVKIWSSASETGMVQAVKEVDLLVINYAQLRILSVELAGVPWLAVVLDEGQFIKNPESLTARAARALQASHRLVLSGTPIENRLLDLWSLMAFAMPGVLGNRAHFIKRYNNAEDPLARRRLSARVRPFLLRRTKGQVATELPDRIEEDLYCEMEGVQATLYRAEYKRARQILLNINSNAELNEQRFHFLTSLLRLRQICCHPSLYSPEAATAESAKLNALMELIEPLMEEGHKVLVFSQFVTMLNLLKPLLTAREWPTYYLAGDTENRGELVADFQNANGAAVFLLSLKAGSFGLNLTAASYVVLFDPWWNPAVENQAIDRTHRIGQNTKVIAYRLLTKGSIEEKIRTLQRQKQALAQDILGEESFSQGLTLEDLHFLFSEEPAEVAAS